MTFLIGNFFQLPIQTDNKMYSTIQKVLNMNFEKLPKSANNEEVDKIQPEEVESDEIDFYQALEKAGLLDEYIKILSEASGLIQAYHEIDKKIDDLDG